MSSDEASTTPSTLKQFDLANILKDELIELGLTDVIVSEHCIVTATLPTNCDSNETVGFIAHLDTIPGFSGTNVKPNVITNYDGSVIELKNITFGTPEDDNESQSTNYLYKGFWAFDKFIFGANVKMSGTGLRLGGGYGHTGVSNKVEIHSGTYNYVYPAGLAWASTTRTAYGAYYDFYGGTINNFYGGYMSNTEGSPCILGDYIVNVYGGNFVRGMHIGSRNKNHGYVAGNTVYNVQGGSVEFVNFGTDYTEEKTAKAGRGNVAVIINGKKDSLTTVKATHPGYIGKAEGKKFMVILNNAEGGNAAIDRENQKLLDILDYKVAVLGGKGTPVFDGTGENSTFLGFAFEEDNNGTSPIYINGTVATPAGTQDG